MSLSTNILRVLRDNGPLSINTIYKAFGNVDPTVLQSTLTMLHQHLLIEHDEMIWITELGKEELE